jgi:hypothetical protein
LPARDSSHEAVQQAVINDGWVITDDPYVISYGDRFLFIDLGASRFIGICRGDQRIAIEIKQFKGQSQVTDLEEAIGQYLLYKILLNQVDPDRDLYLAISETTYNDIFREPIGQLAIVEIPLKLLIINIEHQEIIQWIP